MSTKIIITGLHTIDKMNIAKKIIEKNDSLSIAPTFTSDTNYLNKTTDNYMYYMKPEDVELTFKNNAFLYMSTENYISHGITLDSLYNDDIFCMTLEDFNNISDHILAKYDVIVVWLDSKFVEKDKYIIRDINECKYLEERLIYTPYLYFMDESNEKIIDTILKYLVASEEEKNAILKENN